MAKVPPSVRKYLAAQLKKARAAKAQKAAEPKNPAPTPVPDAQVPSDVRLAARALRDALDRFIA